MAQGENVLANEDLASDDLTKTDADGQAELEDEIDPVGSADDAESGDADAIDAEASDARADDGEDGDAEDGDAEDDDAEDDDAEDDDAEDQTARTARTTARTSLKSPILS